MPFIGRWELGHRFNVVWTFALLVGCWNFDRLAWHHDHYGNTEESQALPGRRGQRRSGSRTGRCARKLTDRNTANRRINAAADRSENARPKAVSRTLRGMPRPRATGRTDVGCRAGYSRRESNCLEPVGLRHNRIGCAEFSTQQQIAGPHFFGNTQVQRRRDGEVGQGNHRRPAERAEGEARRTGKVPAVDRGCRDRPRQPNPVASSDRLPNWTTVPNAGRKAIVEVFACIDCHKFREKAPSAAHPISPATLHANGSRRSSATRPTSGSIETTTTTCQHSHRIQATPANRLTPDEITTLVAWLRGDWYEPPAAENPVSTAPAAAK